MISKVAVPSGSFSGSIVQELFSVEFAPLDGPDRGRGSGVALRAVVVGVGVQIYVTAANRIGSTNAATWMLDGSVAHRGAADEGVKALRDALTAKARSSEAWERFAVLQEATAEEDCGGLLVQQARHA